VTFTDGIADNGTITGGYSDAKGVSHGFLYRAGKFMPLDVPHSANTSPACISATSGLVVGIYTTAHATSNPIGFTYRNGVFRTLRDPAASHGTEPQCGNDLGRVVGYYFDRHARQHGFKFTPGRVQPGDVRPGPAATASAPPSVRSGPTF
jgi:hypothetical protein